MTLSKIVLAATAERGICLSSRAASSPREESKKRSRGWKEGERWREGREADQGLPSFQVYYSRRPRFKHRFIGLWKCLRIANSYWIVEFLHFVPRERDLQKWLKIQGNVGSLMKFSRSNFKYVEFIRPSNFTLFTKIYYYLIWRRDL